MYVKKGGIKPMMEDHQTNSKAIQRKQKFEGRKKTTKRIMIVAIVFIGLILAGGFYVITMGSIQQQTPPPAQKPVSESDTEVSLATGEITSDASFYDYDASGVTIRYFAVKDAQGNIHVALDACDVCYDAKKGYQQQGTMMQCLNCGRQFAITSIGTENKAGGCWPSHLPMTTQGNQVIIKTADLLAKTYLFA
jgi:uncharacterized membrane protein